MLCINFLLHVFHRFSAPLASSMPSGLSPWLSLPCPLRLVTTSTEAWGMIPHALFKHFSSKWEPLRAFWVYPSLCTTTWLLNKVGAKQKWREGRLLIFYWFLLLWLVLYLLVLGSVSCLAISIASLWILYSISHIFYWPWLHRFRFPTMIMW